MKRGKTANSQDVVTQMERDLVFTIADGKNQVLIYIHQIRSVCCDAKDTDYLKILQWIAKEKLTGLSFLGWYKDKFDFSPLNLIAYVRKQIHNDFKIRKVFANHRR